MNARAPAPRRRHLLPALIMLTGLFATAGPVHAQNAVGRRADNLFALLPDSAGKKACFARRYDAAHLKAHGKQKVTAIVLSIAFRHPPREEDPDAYGFKLSINTKGRTRTLVVEGLCHEMKKLTPGELDRMPEDQRAYTLKERSVLKGTDTVLQCYVECDGGGVLIERAEGGTALLVHLDRIRMVQACETEKAIEITGGEDDRLFRLDQARPVACRSLDRD